MGASLRHRAVRWFARNPLYPSPPNNHGMHSLLRTKPKLSQISFTFAFQEANRLAVVWLKLWDFYTFGKRYKTELLSEKDQKVLEVEEKKPHLPKLKVLDSNF